MLAGHPLALPQAHRRQVRKPDILYFVTRSRAGPKVRSYVSPGQRLGYASRKKSIQPQRGAPKKTTMNRAIVVL